MKFRLPLFDERRHAFFGVGRPRIRQDSLSLSLNSLVERRVEVRVDGVGAARVSGLTNVVGQAGPVRRDIGAAAVAGPVRSTDESLLPIGALPGRCHSRIHLDNFGHGLDCHLRLVWFRKLLFHRNPDRWD